MNTIYIHFFKVTLELIKVKSHKHSKSCSLFQIGNSFLCKYQIVLLQVKLARESPNSTIGNYNQFFVCVYLISSFSEVTKVALNQGLLMLNRQDSSPSSGTHQII